VDVTRACLQRIETDDPALNAFCLVDPDRALADARGAEGRWRAGDPCGALDGVPVAIKDVLPTVGWPTLRGSRAIDPDQAWETDAPAVAAVRRHGGVLVGKTTTPELGWKAVTDSPLTGVSRNPWDQTRTCGGSSGGSAVALATGMAALSIGTDGGGSIRVPSAFCGLPGLKPTFGRVPAWPASPFGDLSHVGPMARTVADLALMLDVLVEPDLRAWSALPPPGYSYRDRLADGASGLRIAWSPTLGYVNIESEVAEVTARAAAAFEELGASVEAVDPGFADPRGAFDVLWSSGAAKAVANLGGSSDEILDPDLVGVVRGGRRHSALAFIDALQRRDELAIQMSLFHRDWDLLLTPTVPLTAFAAGRQVPEGWPDPHWPSWTGFTYPFNLTQQPAASVPCGVSADGLPIGLQIVGPRFRDDLVLRAAAAYEAAHPAPLPPGATGA
jgi:aspartyl-tRNA(Asn)/glutamyl-tRNA(Gln) amidotransferase subunit A